MRNQYYLMLFEQAEQLDEEPQDLLTAILIDDRIHFYDRQGNTGPESASTDL